MKTIINQIPTMILRLLSKIVLLADSHPTIIEKVKYFFIIISTFTPIAWLINSVSGWYFKNNQFANFILVAITLNLVIGAWYHHKNNTFSWESFFKRNILITTILFLSYTMLEMLRKTIGDNFISEGFGTIIQISTLLYPTSKALKNLFILSNNQFPPAFIMERLYNFEKSGNLKDLFPDNNEPKKEE